MILSNAQAHQEIQRLQRALQDVTAERDAAIARSNEAHALSRQLCLKLAARDATIKNIYRECFL